MVFMLLAFFGEVLMVLATIPLCILCCCTKKPQQVSCPVLLHDWAPCPAFPPSLHSL